MKSFNSKWHCALAIDSRQGGREENQDCFGCVDTSFGCLVVVCDGMGGGPAGANASTLAVQSIIQSVSRAPQAWTHEKVLQGAVEEANALLRRSIKEHAQLAGMGTTCVAALITPNIATIIHVGDSRFYHLRQGGVALRTNDHSYVGEMVQRGELTEEEARNAECSNIITRSLGIADTVQPDLCRIQLSPADRLVLCTDGMWGAMPEGQLVQLWCKELTVDDVLTITMNKVEALGQADEKSHYDNFTLAIVQVQRNGVAPTADGKAKTAAVRRRDHKDSKKGGSHFKRLFFVIFIIACLISNAYFMYHYFSRDKEKEELRKALKMKKEELNLRRENLNREDLRLQLQFEKRKEQLLKDSLSSERQRKKDSAYFEKALRSHEQPRKATK